MGSSALPIETGLIARTDDTRESTLTAFCRGAGTLLDLLVAEMTSVLSAWTAGTGASLAVISKAVGLMNAAIVSLMAVAGNTDVEDATDTGASDNADARAAVTSGP